MRKCSAIILVALSVITCKGQTAIGNRVGLGLWHWDLPDVQNVSALGRSVSIACPQVSLLADIPLARWLSLRPELGFAQRGGRTEDVPFFSYVDLQRYSLSTRINCLDVGANVLAGIERGQWGLQVLAGANFARRMTVRQVATGGPFPGQGQDASGDVDDLALRTTAFYLNGGVVIRRSLGALKVFLEYRYQQGLTPLERTGWGSGDGDAYTRERGHVLSLGLLIPVRRASWIEEAPSALPPSH